MSAKHVDKTLAISEAYDLTLRDAAFTPAAVMRTKVLKACAKLGVQTLGDLQRVGLGAFREVKSAGPGTLDLLQRVADHYGLSLLEGLMPEHRLTKEFVGTVEEAPRELAIGGLWIVKVRSEDTRGHIRHDSALLPHSAHTRVAVGNQVQTWRMSAPTKSGQLWDGIYIATKA